MSSKKNTVVLRIILFFALLAITTFVVAFTSVTTTFSDDRDAIHLKKARLSRGGLGFTQTNKDTFSLHHNKFYSVKADTHKHSFLIKFKKDVAFTSEMKNEFLEKYGISLSHYLPHHSFIVHATQQQMDTVSSASDLVVDFITEYHPEHKTSTDLSSEEALEAALYNKIATRRAKANENVKDFKESLTLEEKYERDLIEMKQEKERIPIAIYIFKSSGNGIDSVLSEMKEALDVNKIQYHVFQKASSEKLVMAISFDQVFKAIEIISHHSVVHWIDLLNLSTFRDNRTNRWLVQSNQPSNSPFTSVGLTGKNQVVGYGDSGLDVFNCFFYDDQHPVPFYNATTPLKATGHRKIIGYNSFMDELDDEVGHGTHVGGTLAGQSLYSEKPISAYNGIADHAKIAFMDIGCSKEGGCQCHGLTGCPCDLMLDQTCPSGGELYMPADLNEGYFPFSYRLGARIHSNSIGGVIHGAGYGIESKEIDQFIYDQNDFLVIWSAGNSGRNDGYMTLTGPLKQAKNALIVGAGVSAYEGWEDMVQNFKDYTAAANNYRKPLWSANFCSCNTTCHMNVCDSLRKIDSEEGCCQYFNDCAIPMPEQKKNPIANVASMCCRKCAVENLHDRNNAKFYQFENLATFSSLGPAIDGRIKPDIIAPGSYVLSAKAHLSNPELKCTPERADDATLQVQPMQGTSMATPTAASTALLVRDYFESGFYPTGEQRSSDERKPSAALVKAVMIDCARPMTGIARWRVEGSDENPSIHLIHFSDLAPNHRRYFEGHGLLQLTNTLYLKGHTQNKLYVTDRTAISTGYSHYYDLPISTSGNVSITLVWTDYPGSPASSIALVNDLDLEAVVDNKVSLGNSLDESTGKNPDRLNNVEKIMLKNVAANTHLQVIVRGHNVPHGPQQYALVVSGAGVEHESVKFKELKDSNNKKPETPKDHILMPIGLFVFLVGGEGLVIAVLLAIVITLLILRYRAKNSSYASL